MYKLTCFAPIEPEKLGELLKGIRFTPVKNGFEWYMENAKFRIEPFENQPRDSMKAYRVSFNGDIHGGMYLFDLSIGCIGGKVTAVEYVLDHPQKKHLDWIKDLRKRPSYKMIDGRGLFMKDGMSVIATNDTLVLKLHSGKNQKLITFDCLRRIDSIREELQPVDFDLFSCLEEEIA